MTDRLTRDEVPRQITKKQICKPLCSEIGGQAIKKLFRKEKSPEQNDDTTPILKAHELTESEFLRQLDVKRSNSDETIKTKSRVRSFSRSTSLRINSDDELEDSGLRPKDKHSYAPSFEQEEEFVSGQILKLSRHDIDAKKAAEMFHDLARVVVVWPHYNAVSPIAKAMTSFCDSAVVTNEALGAATNLKCCHANEIIECAMKAAQIFPKDVKLQAKLIPILGNRSVDFVINTLRANYNDVDVVTQACLFFSQLSSELEKSTIREVISMLNASLLAHSKQAEVVNLALASLVDLSKTNQGKQALSHNLSVNDLVPVLSSHSIDSNIVLSGITLFMYLGELKDFEPEEAISRAMKVKQIVLQAMNVFPQHKKIHEMGCRTLFYLPLQGDVKKATSAALDSMRLLDNGTTALVLLVLFTSKPEYSKEFIALDGARHVIKKMKDNEDKISLQEKGCALFANMLHLIPGKESIKLETANLLVRRLRENQDNKFVASSVMYGFYRLSITHVKLFSKLNCGSLILQSLQDHLKEPYLQEYGCGLLSCLMLSMSNEIDHSDALLAILAALVEHSSNMKVFESIRSCLKLVFDCYGPDPMWIQEFLPLVECACYEFPFQLKQKVYEATNLGKISRPCEQDYAKEEYDIFSESIMQPKESLNYRSVFMILPPNLSISQVLRKISGGDLVCYTKEQNLFSGLGVEKYNWFPKGEEIDFCIKLNLVEYSATVPLQILFSKEALYLLILDTEDFASTLQSSQSPVFENANPANDYFHGSGAFDALSEHAFDWIVKIHSVVPGGLIMPICLTNEFFNRRNLHQLSASVEGMLEKHYPAISTNGKSLAIPNVLFDFFKDISLRRKNRKINGFSELRKNTIRTLHMMESTLTRNKELRHSATFQAIEIILQLKQCFHIMEKNECFMYIDTVSQGALPDRNIRLALDYLGSKGEIIQFNNLGKEVHNQSFIVLNSNWIMVAINCIYRGGNFEELVLEIRETKRDCFFDEEAIISPFEQYLNCPLITREDLDLLLKNNDSFSSSLNDEKGLKLIRLILKELGVIDPIEIGSSNYVLNPYFIPKLLEVKDRSVWSYSCSNPRIKTICNTWLIENRSPEGLAKSVIKVLLEYSHSFTQVQSGVYGHIINLSEAFCWENGALLKFSVKKPKCATADFVEISLEFVNRLSDLCIAPDEMKAHQQRILLSAKGPSYDLNIIKDGGFLMAAMAVETILGSISDLRYERQLVCPCCLETHRIQDAETLNYDFVQSHTCLEVMECAKGHFIPKLLRF